MKRERKRGDGTGEEPYQGGIPESLTHLYETTRPLEKEGKRAQRATPRNSVLSPQKKKEKRSSMLCGGKRGKKEGG